MARQRDRIGFTAGDGVDATSGMVRSSTGWPLSLRRPSTTLTPEEFLAGRLEDPGQLFSLAIRSAAGLTLDPAKHPVQVFQEKLHGGWIGSNRTALRLHI